MNKRWIVLLLVPLLATPALAAGQTAPTGQAPAVAGSAAAKADATGSVEERRLQVTLQQEYERLQQRELALQEREMKLKTLQAEVDKRLAELQKLRSEVDGLLARKKKGEQERAAQLAKMYEKMEPANVARLLVGLEEPLAVQVLGKMRPKAAGKVLNQLDADTAARLSQLFTTHKFNE